MTTTAQPFMPSGANAVIYSKTSYGGFSQVLGDGLASDTDTLQFVPRSIAVRKGVSVKLFGDAKGHNTLKVLHESDPSLPCVVTRICSLKVTHAKANPKVEIYSKPGKRGACLTITGMCEIDASDLRFVPRSVVVENCHLETFKHGGFRTALKTYKSSQKSLPVPGTRVRAIFVGKPGRGRDTDSDDTDTTSTDTTSTESETDSDSDYDTDSSYETDSYDTDSTDSTDSSDDDDDSALDNEYISYEPETMTLELHQEIDFDGEEIDEDSYEILDAIARVIRNRSVHLTIAGIYKGKASGVKNYALRRATNVYDYLKEEGVSEMKMKFIRVEVAHLDKARVRFQVRPIREHFSTESVRTIIPVVPVRDPGDSRKTIALDLDETLIHYKKMKTGKRKILLRPHAISFFEEVGRLYEVFIFTRAKRDYAKRAIKMLNPHDKVHVAALLDRDIGSYNHKGENIKDLSVLNRDLAKLLILDNTTSKFVLHKENGIGIKSWRGEPGDHELPKYLKLLRKLAQPRVKDVRKMSKTPQDAKRTDLGDNRRRKK